MEKFIYTLNNKGEITSPDTSFSTAGKEYSFLLNPSSANWSFEIVFSQRSDARFEPGLSQFNDPAFKVLRFKSQISSAEGLPEQYEVLMTYHHLKDERSYPPLGSYKDNKSVEVILDYDNKLSALNVLVIADHSFLYKTTLFDDFKYFKIFSSLKRKDYHLDVTVTISDFSEHPALELIQKNMREHTTKLDLSNTGMVEIPRKTGAMDWLQELIIGDNSYWDFRTEATITTQNKGYQNTFTALPDEMALLRNLEKLVIVGNESVRLNITNLPVISQLHKLNYLFIEHADVSDISFLAGLENIKYLSLFDNNITDISSLSFLWELQYLVLSENPLRNIDVVSGLKKLRYLSFIKTDIRDLPGFSGLANLTQLYFSNTAVSDISPLSILTNLEKLSFSFTQVDEIASLAKLQRLSTLNFQSCRVKHLLPYLANLRALVQFNCSGNPVEDCPADIYETGDPKQLMSYYHAKEEGESYALSKAGTVVATSKEIKLRRVAPGKPDTRRDVKLIILGNSNVGKTNLVNYLETGKFTGERNTTHGLEVHRWVPDERRFPQLKDIAVSIWDFGGQEYYHGAYRLFLSDNALYLLLWEKETNKNAQLKAKLQEKGPEVDLENFEIRYWLDTILHYNGSTANSTGNDILATDGRTNKSRLITLQNKVDNSDTDKERLDQQLHKKYTISDSFHVSLLQGSNITNARQYKTLEYFLSELADAINISADKLSVPPRWQQVRNTIIQLKGPGRKTNPFSSYIKQDLWISIDDFEKACNRFLTTPLSKDEKNNEVYTLPRWLEKGGTVVYFPNIPKLQDKIFLRPDVLAKRIYEVLKDDVRKAGGEFSADEIFSGKEKEFKSIFLELAQHLELIFPHPIKGQGYYLAPQYLPETHPIEDLFKIASHGAWQTALWVKLPLFYYKKALHGILLHYASPGVSAEFRYFWKHGIMFVKDGLRVLIKGLYPEEDQHEGVILIGVEKDPQKQVALQAEIFNKFRSIIADREKTGTGAQQATQPAGTENIKQAEEKKIAADIDMQVSYDGKNYVSYKDLLANASEPKIKALNDVMLITYNFSAILPTAPQRAKRVFLSYSHQNTPWLGRLRTHLAGLRRDKRIETWDDKEILPGDLWDNAIRQNLEKADVFILLLSADFIASDYIWNNELPNALDGFRKRNAIVIPILFEPLDLGGLSVVSESTGSQPVYKISDFEIIPKNANGHLQAVSLWPNQEEALAKIAERIREAVKKS